MKTNEIQLSDRFDYMRLLRFIMPTVAMMIFTSIYGVVDGFFASNLAGKTDFAAVNIIFPFLMLVGTIGFMFGTGISLSYRNLETARKTGHFEARRSKI